MIKSHQLYQYLFDICCNIFILQRLLGAQNVFCKGKACSKYFERIQVESLGLILDPYFTQTYPFSQLIQVNKRCGFVIFCFRKLGLIVHVDCLTWKRFVIMVNCCGNCLAELFDNIFFFMFHLIITSNIVSDQLY